MIKPLSRGLYLFLENYLTNTNGSAIILDKKALRVVQKKGDNEMKKVKVEWCENWIKALFTKHHPIPGGGIELGLFWDKAEASGLWERGTYGTPMSIAASNLLNFEIQRDENGKFCYHFVRLKENRA